MLMWHEPAACGANPAQHSIVQRCPADAEPKGIKPESNASTRTTATIIRRRNPGFVCAALKRCTVTPRMKLSLKNYTKVWWEDCITRKSIEAIGSSGVRHLERLPHILNARMCDYRR